MEEAYRYYADIVRFITRIRLLSDPSLTSRDDVTAGDSFESFWRTLIYNRAGDDLREESQPESTIGYLFAYWYLGCKLYLTRKWEQDPNSFTLHLNVLRKLVAPFGRMFHMCSGSRFFL
ncbi:hypothetical protein C8A03DRAFT_19481, partial [Achaetomium macrosporum]